MKKRHLALKSQHFSTFYYDFLSNPIQIRLKMAPLCLIKSLHFQQLMFQTKIWSLQIFIHVSIIFTLITVLMFIHTKNNTVSHGYQKLMFLMHHPVVFIRYYIHYFLHMFHYRPKY